MSHATGKIEIVGADDDHICMRYHHAHRKVDYGQMIVTQRDDEVLRLDQLELVSGPPSLMEPG